LNLSPFFALFDLYLFSSQRTENRSETPRFFVAVAMLSISLRK
jgi:hypothetical protein